MVTDFDYACCFDDFLGGNERSVHRRYGYLDDVADTILMGGTILALLFVVNRAGLMSWLFFVPAAILIGREVIVGLFKGFELSRYYFPDTLLSNLKAGLSMLATCLLLASPWLQVWLDRMFAGTDKVAETFATSSPMVWMIGQIILWIAAALSIVTAVGLFRVDVSSAETE